MRAFGSLILECRRRGARSRRLRARGGSRRVLGRRARERESHPRITVVRGESHDPSVARHHRDRARSPPMRSRRRFARGSASTSLAFYDAIAPDLSRRFDRPRRRLPRIALRQGDDGGRGDEGAYLNCPMSARAVRGVPRCAASRPTSITAHEFDEVPYFEGCMPVEEMARARARDAALRTDEAGRAARSAYRPRCVRGGAAPHGGSRGAHVEPRRVPDAAPHPRAAASLPHDPGLANAEFLRYGSIHRNSYVNSPAALTPQLTLRDEPPRCSRARSPASRATPRARATGLLAGINLARTARAATSLRIPPATTMLGALYRYLREADPRALPADERELRAAR